MGQSKPSKNRGRRAVTVQSAEFRSKEWADLLKKEFDRIQEGSTITETAFRSEILGAHVPLLLGRRIYQMFSSPIISENQAQQEYQSEDARQYIMTLDDFKAFYVVFKQQLDAEMGEVAFELLKMSTFHPSKKPIQLRRGNQPMQGQHNRTLQDEEYIMKEDVRWFASFSTDNGQQQMNQFFILSKYDTQFAITKTDFVEAWHFAKLGKLEMFKWIPNLVTGPSLSFLNLDTDSAPAIQTKLTRLIEDTTKKDMLNDEMSRLTPQEVDSVAEFFNREIKNRPASDMMKVFNKMFKDVQNVKLKKYFMTYVSTVQGHTLQAIAELVLAVCKTSTQQKVCEYLFDIFSKGSSQIRKQGLKDFAEVFKLKAHVFRMANTMSKAEFSTELQDQEMDLSPLLAIRPMLTAMTAVVPEDDEAERAAILAALDNNRQLSSYIYENLPEESEFYVLEKGFWDQWCTSMNFEAESKFSIKKERKVVIDNKALMEERHEYRLKDVSYKQDFVLVPKYVFLPLSKWYKCEKTITRQVIQYKAQRLRGPSDNTSVISMHSSAKFMMSSQKFYNPQQEEFEEELSKRVLETVYELEIHPILVYLSIVEENGERPHKQAVINGRVDQNYLKRVVKTDKLPFQEIQVSRKTTLFHLLNLAAQTHDRNIKRGRLLIEDQVISGSRLNVTLEEFCLQQGQLIFAEFCNSSNEYPTDLLNERKVADKKRDTNKQGNNGKSAGLQNLGNTCYMNSAIQVLANLKIFHEYFVIRKMHNLQMSLRNPLGHQGQLVNSFGILLERMWASQNVVVPRGWKQVLGRCCEQFMGYDQQDSQEYISFLIDALHEELNLRQKKPYIENPDSKDRDLNELGLEQWSNNLQRNWSIIYFTFYGLMQSTIQCGQCLTKSSTFDIFSNVPLSLPEPSQQSISLLVYRVPNRIKDILAGRITRDEDGKVSLAGYERAFSERESESGMMGHRAESVSVHRMQSSQSTRDRRHLAQFSESYNYMNNDQPMHIKVKVDNDIKIKDLITKVIQIREVNIDPTQAKTEVVIFQINPNKGIRGIFMPDRKLSNYHLIGTDLIAFEVLTRTGRECIRKFYLDHKEFVEKHPETLLQILTIASEKGDRLDDRVGEKFIARDQMAPPPNLPNIGRMSVQRPITGESEMSESDYSQSVSNQVRGIKRPAIKIDRYNLFQILYDNTIHWEEINYKYEVPNDIFIIAYHRRFIKKSEFLFCQYSPQLISSPVILSVPLVPSGRRLYDEVWASAHVLLKANSKFHRKQNRWWELKDWKKFLLEPKSVFMPFVLKAVDRTGNYCATCHWIKKCNGCIIEPKDAPLFEEDMLAKVFIAIEWNSKILEEQYNQIANEVVEHVSTRERIHDLDGSANYTTLDDCIQKFHLREQLENEITCSKCKVTQIHYKKMLVFMPPPVLVIQLKRFRLQGNVWKKLQNLVDFPIRNLDLGPYMQDANFIKQTYDIEAVYDLHGIVNHFGTLGFGHYISFAKNPFDKKWYRYDDTHREEIPEEKLSKETAYLLFYIRKDVADSSLDKLFPNIEHVLFPGKPVHTKAGKTGFIVNKVAPEKKEVVVKIVGQPERQTIQVDQLKSEEDKHVIEYTLPEQKKMQHYLMRSAKVRLDNGSGDLDIDEDTGKETQQMCCGLFRFQKSFGKKRQTMSFDRSKRQQQSLEGKNQQQQELKPMGMMAPPGTDSARNTPIHRTAFQQNEVSGNDHESSFSASIAVQRPLINSDHAKGVKEDVLRNSAEKKQGSERNPDRRSNLFMFGKGKNPNQITETLQSQEGGLGQNRHKFKIPDPNVEESVMSHFSNSDGEDLANEQKPVHPGTGQHFHSKAINMKTPEANEVMLHTANADQLKAAVSFAKEGQVKEFAI